MQRESLHCGELIKRLNDILGRCANEELRADDMTSSQVKMLMIINETKDECITLKELEALWRSPGHNSGNSSEA